MKRQGALGPPVQLRTFDELDPSLEAQRALLQLTAFGGLFGRRPLERWRKLSEAMADYVGVFAVERGEVIGQTFVVRLPYEFPEGPDVVGGIAAVATRPDLGQRGIARKVLEEVHRREHEAGADRCLLWTNRSWRAHGLYERLGYRDLYDIPTAVKVPGPGRRRAARLALRPARSQEAEAIEELHARVGEGKLGFVRRPRGSLRAAIATEELDPRTGVLVSRRGRELSGYAVVPKEPYRTGCGELVTTSPALGRQYLDALERRAGDRTLVLQYSVVHEHRKELLRRGYAILDASWFVLMGRSWDGPATPASLHRAFGTREARFRCFVGDRF